MFTTEIPHISSPQNGEKNGGTKTGHLGQAREAPATLRRWQSSCRASEVESGLDG